VNQERLFATRRTRSMNACRNGNNVMISSFLKTFFCDNGGTQNCSISKKPGRWSLIVLHCAKGSRICKIWNTLRLRSLILWTISSPERNEKISLSMLFEDKMYAWQGLRLIESTIMLILL